MKIKISQQRKIFAIGIELLSKIFEEKFLTGSESTFDRLSDHPDLRCNTLSLPRRRGLRKYRPKSDRNIFAIKDKECKL
jgi:hypothetical protein